MSDPTPVTVTAAFRRTSYTDDMFADLVREDVRVCGHVPGKPCWSITFMGTESGPALSEVERAAVIARMESIDDDDQDKRADLRAKRAAVVTDPSLENVAALAVATAAYQLGE